MKRNGHFGAAVLVLVGLQLGCIGRWRPPDVQVKPVAQPTTQPSTQPTLATYLQAARYGYWVYERRELPENPEHRPVRYARRMTQEEMVEGHLRDGRMPDLPSARTSTQPAGQAPRPAQREGLAARFELAEPLSPLPADLELGRPNTFSTSIRYRYVDGRDLAEGTLTRTAVIEGVEAVDVPAGHFENCLRVRVELAIRFHWGPTFDWTSYLWFSPTAGEVRRVNRLAGFFFIFWFGSAHEYNLLSHEGRPTTTAPAGLPDWSGGTLLLTRTIPKPVIGGMRVAFAKP